MPVIAVFNQKGGVGKTTTALNVGAALATRSRRPVLIDLDPQSSLSLSMGLRAVEADSSVYAFFRDGRPLSSLVRSQPSGVRLIPSSLELSKVEALHGSDPAISRRLREGIEAELALAGSLILIDCCPMLGVLTLNALIAADRVLMPVSADYLSLEGVHKLDAALGVLEQRLGKRFLRRVVATRFDARRRLSYEIHRELNARFAETMCQTVISETVSLAESPMRGKDIFAYAPHSQGAKDYRALTEELEAGNFFQ